MRHIRHILFAALLLCSATAWCFDGSSGNSRTLFIAGYTNFRPYALNDRFGLTGENQFLQLLTYGIGTTSSLVIQRNGTADGAFSFMLYQPQEAASAADTSVLRIRGWELMTSLYGYDLLKSVKAIDFVIAPGVYWGKLKLTRKKVGPAAEPTLYKNPFIAPMLRVDLRFNFWKCCIGGRVSFRYDITNDNWKIPDEDLIDPPGYRFREAQYAVYIGIKLVREEWFDSSERPDDDFEN